MVGDEPLGARILVLERPQALRIADLQVAVALLPGVERLPGDVVPAHELRRGRPGRVLLQDGDDLLRSESGLLNQGYLVVGIDARWGPAVN